MAGHEQLKFVMTECSKTQIRLARLICGFDNWRNFTIVGTVDKSLNESLQTPSPRLRLARNYYNGQDGV